MKATRHDAGSVRKAIRTPEGFLRVDAVPTRTGIFQYSTGNGGVWRELRPAEEVFHADSLASFNQLPVTDDHPPEMVDASNARQYTRGNAADIRRDGDYVRASLLVTDAVLIEKMEAGKRQLSCGYTCDLDETPGVFRGQKYDAIQRNIRGNHIAVVERGRAGADCAARMDGDYVPDEPRECPRCHQVNTPTTAGVCPNCNQSMPMGEDVDETYGEVKTDAAKTPNKDPKMKRVVIDGIAYEVSESAADAVAKLQARADAAASELQKVQARADQADADLKKVQAERKDVADKMPAMVRARVALEKTASEHLDAEDLGDKSVSELSDRDVKLAVIKKLSKADCSSREDVYVDARYDAAVEHAAVSNGESALRDVNRAADDAVGRDVKTGRVDLMDHVDYFNKALEQRWKQPIAGERRRPE